MAEPSVESTTDEMTGTFVTDEMAGTFTGDDGFHDVMPMDDFELNLNQTFGTFTAFNLGDDDEGSNEPSSPRVKEPESPRVDASSSENTPRKLSRRASSIGALRRRLAARSSFSAATPTPSAPGFGTPSPPRVHPLLPSGARPGRRSSVTIISPALQKLRTRCTMVVFMSFILADAIDPRHHSCDVTLSYALSHRREQFSGSLSLRLLIRFASSDPTNAIAVVRKQGIQTLILILESFVEDIDAMEEGGNDPTEGMSREEVPQLVFQLLGDLTTLGIGAQELAACEGLSRIMKVLPYWPDSGHKFIIQFLDTNRVASNAALFRVLLEQAAEFPPLQPDCFDVALSGLKTARDLTADCTAPLAGLAEFALVSEDVEQRTKGLGLLDKLLYYEDCAQALQPSHRLIQQVLACIRDRTTEQVAVITLQKMPMTSFLRECVANAASILADLLQRPNISEEIAMAIMQLVQLILSSPTQEAKSMSNPTKSDLRKAVRHVDRFNKSEDLHPMLATVITKMVQYSQLVMEDEPVLMVQITMAFHQTSDRETVAALACLVEIAHAPLDAGGGWIAIRNECDEHDIDLHDVLLRCFGGASAAGGGGMGIGGYAVQLETTVTKAFTEFCDDFPISTSMSTIDATVMIAAVSKVARLDSKLSLLQSLQRQVTASTSLMTLTAVQTLSKTAADFLVPEKSAHLNVCFEIALRLDPMTVFDGGLSQPVAVGLPAVGGSALPLLNCARSMCLLQNPLVDNFFKQKNFPAAVVLHASSHSLPPEALAIMAVLLARWQENAAQILAGNPVVGVLIDAALDAEGRRLLTESEVSLVERLHEDFTEPQRKIEEERKKIESEQRELKHTVGVLMSQLEDVRTESDSKAKEYLNLESEKRRLSSVLDQERQAKLQLEEERQELLAKQANYSATTAEVETLKNQLTEAQMQAEESAAKVELAAHLEEKDNELKELHRTQTTLRKELTALKEAAAAGRHASAITHEEEKEAAEAQVKALQAALERETERNIGAANAQNTVARAMLELEASEAQCRSDIVIQLSAAQSGLWKEHATLLVYWKEFLAACAGVEAAQHEARTKLVSNESSSRHDIVAISLASQQESVQRTISFAKMKMEAEQGHARRLSDDMKTMQATNEALSQEIAEAKGQVEREQRRAKVDQQRSAEQTQANLAEMSANLLALGAEADRAKKERQDLNVELTSLRRTFASDMEGLGKERDALAKLLDSASTERNDLRGELTSSKTELGDAQFKLERHQAESRQAAMNSESQLTSLKAELSAVRSEMSVHETQHQELVDQLREQHEKTLEREMKHIKEAAALRHEQDIRHLHRTIEFERVQAEQMKKEQADKIASLLQELEERPTVSVVSELNLKVEALVAELDTTKRSQSALASVNNDLETETAVLREKFSAAVSSAKEAEVENEQLLQRSAQEKERQQQLQAQLDDLEGQLATARANAALKEAKYQSAEDRQRIRALEAKRLSSAAAFERLASPDRRRSSQQQAAASRRASSPEEADSTALVMSAAGDDDFENPPTLLDEEEGAAAGGGGAVSTAAAAKKKKEDLLASIPSALPFRLLPSRDPKDRYILELLAALNKLKAHMEKADKDSTKASGGAHQWEKQRDSVTSAFREAIQAQKTRYEDELELQRLKIDQLQDIIRRLHTEASPTVPMATLDDIAIRSAEQRVMEKHAMEAQVAASVDPDCPCLCHKDNAYSRIKYRCNCSCGVGGKDGGGGPRQTASPRIPLSARADQGSVASRVRHRIASSRTAAAAGSTGGGGRPTAVPAPPRAANSIGWYPNQTVDAAETPEPAGPPSRSDFKVPGGPLTGGFSYDANSDPHLRNFLAQKRMNRRSGSTVVRKTQHRDPSEEFIV